MSGLIILDLDGVITSEEAYWDTAGLVLHELLYSPRYWHIDKSIEVYHPAATRAECERISSATLPKSVIIDLKARSINSNWDTGYAAIVLCLIDLLARLPDCSLLLPLKPEDAGWMESFRRQLATVYIGNYQTTEVFQFFADPIFRGCVGLELLDQLNVYASQRLGYAIEGVFTRYSPSWLFCQDLFQEWYRGEELYTLQYGHAPAQPGKPGCIHFERPLLPVEQLRTTLETLRTQVYRLGIATGRSKQEALLPLENYGLLSFFDERHISTHDEIARAEAELQAQGDKTLLVKPHPYQFLLAAGALEQPIQASSAGSFIVVGDTPSDVIGGHAAGALVVAVLTGARTSEARMLLEQSGPDFVIEDITKLPALLAYIDSLATIQRLQFTHHAQAELLLRRWFARHMNLHVESVTLTPKATSLNSFNGIYRVAGEDYFFKTHIEEQGVLEEYYNAELLYQAGYHIVRPLRTLHEKEQQMVIYPVVYWPVMFDLMRAVETGDTGAASVEKLVAAEKRDCERLLDIYQSTLAASTADEHACAPIHQLFWHRITGGRLNNFYEGKDVSLPEHEHSLASEVPFAQLLNSHWTINERRYPQTLGELIERAKVVLHPARASMTIIGHGDAHFGNVFLEEERRYLYFDPAFAGRHSPLLDVIKPFFHNVFATWMYFPHEIAQQLQIHVTIRNAGVFVEHNYMLSPVRQGIRDTKIEYLLSPLMALLRSQHALPSDWQEILRLALMCCPLLTINLLNAERVPLPINWLGLCYAIEMAHFDWNREQ
ncbi:MAG: HAD family hydrolase [Ktedonobacteraceae bacterium]|nr:HAD family hydrolase [Ktedonobacteraceae bacterium]